MNTAGKLVLVDILIDSGCETFEFLSVSGKRSVTLPQALSHEKKNSALRKAFAEVEKCVETSFAVIYTENGEKDFYYIKENYTNPVFDLFKKVLDSFSNPSDIPIALIDREKSIK